MFNNISQHGSAKSSHLDLNGSQISNLGAPLDQSTPAFLFGKRTANVPSNYTNSPLNTTSAPCSDIFAYPTQATVPQHVKDTPGSKTVHWSPALVQSNDKPTTPSHTSANISFGGAPSSTTSHAPKTLQTSFGGQAINAPPLRSLRDKIEPAKKIARRNTFAARSTPVSTPVTQRISSHLTTAEEQPEEQEPDAAELWVTVFGFTPNQVSILLNLFSRHGEVVSHQAPSRGNFMHIRYSCVTHAQQALNRNGTLLDQDTFIGVVPCTNKDVINGSAAGIVARSSTSAAANRSLSMYNSFVEPELAEQSAHHNENSILNSSNVFDGNNSLNSSRISVRSSVGMRPLAADQRGNGTSSIARKPQDGLLNKLWNTIGLN